ncbi:MAG TPA: YHYH protein [Candidatus Saccharimonadales bacterium]|nr:YHYH protein [Candidatus Saccharimonadales bacterium]
MHDEDQQNPESDDIPSDTTSLAGVPTDSRRRLPYKRFFFVILGLVIVGAIAFGVWDWQFNKPARPAVTVINNAPTQASQTGTTASNLPGLKLDSTKNYGNKYADGLLPVGDGKYVTTAPKTGYIYTCSNYARNIQVESGGAGKRGPWFTNNNTQYDINKKLHVQGNVMWQAELSNKVSGSIRTIVTNDLPNHPTGTFPISASDPAYTFDRNPNSIKGQTMTYALSTDPSYSSTPNCESGQVGVMLSGVALFNGFDAGGRDAGAWEIQDSCDGHPQSDGIYHYHTLSSCIKNISSRTVIGFALDGFPITGPQVAKNNILTTADLDECHGITGQIVLDGKTTTMYHYVMTQDFPYSVSCFRAKPISPPGEKPSGGPAQNQGSSGGGQKQPGPKPQPLNR